MGKRTALLLMFCVLMYGGCGKKEKSTAELLADLKSGEDRDRLIAVRLLPYRQDDAAEVVPALIEALKDKAADIRLGAAVGLGSFGDKAKDAIPALKLLDHDSDPRVRAAATKALSRISGAAPAAPTAP